MCRCRPASTTTQRSPGRGLWRHAGSASRADGAVSAAGHQFGQCRPGHRGHHKPGVAQVVETQVRSAHGCAAPGPHPVHRRQRQMMLPPGTDGNSSESRSGPTCSARCCSTASSRCGGWIRRGCRRGLWVGRRYVRPGRRRVSPRPGGPVSPRRRGPRRCGEFGQFAVPQCTP